MKKLAIISFVIVCIVQGCCTKKDCNSGLYEIVVRDFNESEIDTIILLSYQNNGQFTNPIDSHVVEGYSNGDGTATLSNYSQLDTNRDYKLLFSGLQKEYKLTDFQIGRKSCNSCFPFGQESDFYDVLEGYRLNGELHQGGDGVSISK